MERLRINKKLQEEITNYVAEELFSLDRLSKITIDLSEFAKVDTKQEEKPTIIITPETYLKMYALVDNTDDEISWHCMVKRSENKYLLYDVLVFPQENTNAHTGTDDKKYTEWLQKLMFDDTFPFNELRCHGHSHVNMNVFSSVTDDEYQTNLTQNIDDGDFYIFLILNKKREMYILLYDFEHNILFDKKDLDIIIPLNNMNLTEWAENTIKENVTKPRYVSTKKPKYLRDDTDDFDDAPRHYYGSWRDNYYGSK